MNDPEDYRKNVASFPSSWNEQSAQVKFTAAVAESILD